MAESKAQKTTKPVKLIAAACSNMGIGNKGVLPWNLPNEYKYFLDTVTTVTQPGKKNLLVMGRRSFEDMDLNLLPLTNTIILLLSKTLSSLPEHVNYICHNEEEMINLVSTIPLIVEIETIWILGGVQCYKNMMQHPWCEQIYLTTIMAEMECDTFFPEFDRDIFKLMENYPGVPSEIQEENGLKYIFQVFQRST